MAVRSNVQKPCDASSAVFTMPKKFVTFQVNGQRQGPTNATHCQPNFRIAAAAKTSPDFRFPLSARYFFRVFCVFRGSSISPFPPFAFRSISFPSLPFVQQSASGGPSSRNPSSRGPVVPSPLRTLHSERGLRTESEKSSIFHLVTRHLTLVTFKAV